MKISITRFVLASAGTIVLSSVANLKPAQAAVFSFKLGRDSGSLSFTTRSQLAGVGYESAKLSQLPTNTQFNIKYTADFQIGSEAQSVVLNTFNFSEPTFYFQDGYLVGIKTEGSAPFSDGGIAGDYGGRIEGDVVVSTQGNIYTSNLMGTEFFYQIVFDEYGNYNFELTGTYPYYSELSSGDIYFDTLEPIGSEPIPEPLTILGTGAAISFAAAFKRKMKKKPDNN